MPYKDPEKQREADRRWRAANLEKAREANRRWREAAARATRRWHEANPEYGRKQNRRWREANLERARVEDAYPDPHLHTLVSSQLSPSRSSSRTPSAPLVTPRGARLPRASLDPPTRGLLLGPLAND